jgi:four helix bundle protein
MYFKFEKLIFWQKAMDLGKKINNITLSFPKKERFNLSSQTIRAVDSIALNISEGSILQSNAEYKRFIGYAVRSLAEVVTCIHKAKNRDYISKKLFDKLYLESYNLMNMMVAFKKNIN